MAMIWACPILWAEKNHGHVLPWNTPQEPEKNAKDLNLISLDSFAVLLYSVNKIGISDWIGLWVTNDAMLGSQQMHPVTTPPPWSKTWTLFITSCFAGLIQNSTFWHEVFSEMQVSYPRPARGGYSLSFTPPPHCIIGTIEKIASKIPNHQNK